MMFGSLAIIVAVIAFVPIFGMGAPVLAVIAACYGYVVFLGLLGVHRFCRISSGAVLSVHRRMTR